MGTRNTGTPSHRVTRRRALALGGAAALFGGVCVAWWNGGDVRAARIADGLPLAPVVAVPSERTRTEQSRNSLPAMVAHADAAANAGFAALLGAAVASGDAELLRAAFNDRLHEQYRADGAPLLGAIRSSATDGALGVTLSGSGPSVVVWTAHERAEDVAARLREALSDDTRVLPLRPGTGSVGPPRARARRPARRVRGTRPPGLGRAEWRLG